MDGNNYDAGGKIWRQVSKYRKNAPEPGRWRVEITPPEPHEHDRFLMVLAPGKRKSPLRVEPLKEGNAIGTRIHAPGNTLELRFPGDREGVLIRTSSPQATRTLDLTLPRAPALDPPGLWARFMEWLR